jgi:cholesterol transport system auxiliary component
MKKNETRGMRHKAWAAALASAALTMAACTGSLFESDIPVSTKYVLADLPPAAAPGTSIAASKDISIGRPDVAPGLDTNRIAVIKGRELDYYRGAAWGGSVNEVVQKFLVNSLEDQRLFRSVTAEQARVAGDYVLDIEVRDFQAEYADSQDAPEVRVTILGRVIRVADRELAGTVSASAQRRATANRMGAVIVAFESAAHQVALELAQKTAATIDADAASSVDRSAGVERP